MRKIQEGEVVSAKLKTAEEHGFTLIYEGENIFVKAVDITWDSKPLCIEQYTLGSIYEVKIQIFFEEKIMGTHYVGSIKDVYPEDNPWSKDAYLVGSIYQVTVELATDYGFFVKLPTGVRGLVKKECNIYDVGDQLLAKIVQSDVERMRLVLEICSDKKSENDFCKLTPRACR